MTKKEKDYSVQISKLGIYIARAVLIAPDISPKTNQVYTHEVVVTGRPGWSGIGKYEQALPGGKISVKDGDFDRILTADEGQDPYFLLTFEQMKAAGLEAAYREVLEELGVALPHGFLTFIDVSVNSKGFVSYSYVGLLEEKPELKVKPNSSGTGWISTDRILNGRPKLLSGHLGIARRGLEKMGMKKTNS